MFLLDSNEKRNLSIFRYKMWRFCFSNIHINCGGVLGKKGAGERGSPPELVQAGHFMEEEGKEDQEGCEKGGLEDWIYWQRKIRVE